MNIYPTNAGVGNFYLDQEARNFLKAMLHRAEEHISEALEADRHNPDDDENYVADLEADAARCLAFINKL